VFAIISHKGNQYKFELNKDYKIDLIDHADDEKNLTFSDVLLISDEKKNIVGSPLVKNASVEAEILGDITDKKVNVFKFHSKKRYQRNRGHREDYTLVKILKINQKNEKNN
jgi:large subunit ribosomal protein L21